MHIDGPFLLIFRFDLSILLRVQLSMVLVTRSLLKVHSRIVKEFDAVWEEQT